HARILADEKLFYVEISALANQQSLHGCLHSFCSNIMTHISLGTPLLMGALVLHGNVSAISGNVSGISRVCGGVRSLG
ncbi:MAG: hypothetical protein WAN27_21100, partial [Xanthobacteraceae bacterium]